MIRKRDYIFIDILKNKTSEKGKQQKVYASLTCMYMYDVVLMPLSKLLYIVNTLRGVIWKFEYTCKVCTMIREKSFEYHCKGSLMYMGMGVILLKWWAIYFLNRLIGQVTVTHSLQYMYMMIRYVLRYSSSSTATVILIV